jgi:hypothetical protein
MFNQLILNFFPSLKDKECLQPLDIDSLAFHWNHKGNFNQELYERVLIRKEKDNESK